jgi:hypothetical protein
MSLLNSCKVTSITSTLYSSFNTTPVTLLCMNPYIQNNPLLFDIKLVIRSPRSIKDRQYKDQKKWTKGQTIIYKTLHRKLRTDQTEPYKNPVRGEHRWQMRTNARTFMKAILTSIKMKAKTMSKEDNRGYIGHMTFRNICITKQVVSIGFQAVFLSKKTKKLIVIYLKPEINIKTYILY